MGSKIASLLDNHVTFHLRGCRAAAPRQQTLSATLDWSYNLLPEVERSVLRRLSVFVGRFSLDAAQVVAAGGAVDGWQVVESTDNLVTKSLASLDPAGPTLRYRLLDTTRRYLYQRLEASGEAAEISRRHAIYYRDLLARAEPERAKAEGSTPRSDHISNVRYAQRRWISTPPSRLDDGGGWRGQNGVSGWERRGRRRPDGSDGVRVDAPTAWMWQNGNIAHHLKEASVGRVGTVGLDLATNVFQVQGADVSGVVIFLKKAAMNASACFFLKPASLHGGDGGLRRWMRPVVGALFFVRK